MSDTNSAVAGPSTEPTPTTLPSTPSPSASATMPYHLPPPSDPATWSPAAAESTPSSTVNPYNVATPSDSALHLSTIVPIFLVIALGLVLLFGLVSWLIRRRRRQYRERVLAMRAGVDVGDGNGNGGGGDGARGERKKRKKKRMEKPRLWEVDVKGMHLERDLEKAYPVALQLNPDPYTAQTHAYTDTKSPIICYPPSHPKPFDPPSPNPSARSNLSSLLPDGLHSSLTRSSPSPQPPRSSPSPQPPPPPSTALVTFLLSMPTPNRAPNEPSREYVIGTTKVGWRWDEDEWVEEKEKASTIS